MRYQTFPHLRHPRGKSSKTAVPPPFPLRPTSTKLYSFAVPADVIFKKNEKETPTQATTLLVAKVGNIYWAETKLAF